MLSLSDCHSICSKTLDSLMEESGCALEHPMAGCFRSNILLGQWKEVYIL